MSRAMIYDTQPQLGHKGYGGCVRTAMIRPTWTGVLGSERTRIPTWIPAFAGMTSGRWGSVRPCYGGVVPLQLSWA